MATFNQFLEHWTLVDAELAPGAAVLTGGYDLADYTADVATMEGLYETLAEDEVTLVSNRVARDSTEPLISERMRQFRAFVNGAHGDSTWARSLPDTPKNNNQGGIWITAMTKFKKVWTEMNADLDPDVILTGGYTLANFTTQTDALSAALTDISESQVSTKKALEDRNDLYDVLRKHLANYRLVVEGSFPAGHAMIESIPRLYPLPGHTPLAPTGVAIVWNVLTSQFDITWNAVDDDALDHYRIDYALASAEDPGEPSTFLASVPAGTLSYSTSVGTSTPGLVISIKVYAVLDTGNEAGSAIATAFVPPDVEPDPDPDPEPGP